MTVVLCGSDDWLSPYYIASGLSYIDEGYDLVGQSRWWMANTAVSPLQLVQMSYATHRIKEPIGAGRLFSRRILDAIKWKLWTHPQERGLDHVSFNNCIAAGAKVKTMNKCSTAHIVSVKGSWKCIDVFDSLYRQAQQRTTLTLWSEVYHVRHWASHNFPLLVDHLSKITTSFMEFPEEL
jgi:hypothetical protein